MYVTRAGFDTPTSWATQPPCLPDHRVAPKARIEMLPRASTRRLRRLLNQRDEAPSLVVGYLFRYPFRFLYLLRRIGLLLFIRLLLHDSRILSVINPFR